MKHPTVCPKCGEFYPDAHDYVCGICKIEEGGKVTRCVFNSEGVLKAYNMAGDRVFDEPGSRLHIGTIPPNAIRRLMRKAVE